MSSTTNVLISPLPHSFPTSSIPTSPRVSKSPRRFSQLVSRQHLFMDAPVPAFAVLSSELVTLVCEQLREIDYLSLCNFRRISKRLNAIATPIVYHTLEINGRLARQDAALAFPSAYNHIAQFTKHVVIHSNLDPVGIRKVLSNTGKLSTITWRCKSEEPQGDGVCLPSDVLNGERLRSDGTKLYVEELPMSQFDDDSLLRAVPSNLLISLKLARPTPPLTTRLAALKRLLIRSHNLEVLCYQDRGQGTQLGFSGDERMPALTDLSLRSYDWNHSDDQVRRHWDFSRLQSLELIAVPCFNFLTSVPFSDLSNLRKLHVEDWSAHLPDRRHEATRLLHDLILYHIRDMDSLEITCHIQLFQLDAILKHRYSLQRLSLRDHVGFGDEERRCPTLDAGDLCQLGVKLPWLHTLDLDMDIRRCNPEAFLRSLQGFRRLDTLTLHIQTVLSPLDEEFPRTDHDYNAAMKIFSTFARERERNKPENPWKKITVNVGGWRRIMVRRLSPAWRELNERGIFAERCFVMERARGEYNVREEMSVESSSGRATPER